LARKGSKERAGDGTAGQPWPTRRERLVLPVWAPALVILPLAVLLIGTWFHRYFLWHEQIGAFPEWKACISHRHEAIGRARLLAAFLPYALVSLLIFLNFVREFVWLFGPRTRRRLALPILLFLAIAVFITLELVMGWHDPLAALGAGFYEAAFARLADCGAGSASAFKAGDAYQPLQILHVLVVAFSALLTLAAGSVIFGTISTLAEPDRSLHAGVRSRYRDMQRQRLDSYLYASALLLVFGLFVMDSAMRWPAEFAEDKALYTQHVNALMLYNGIFYSTILAAYYVPAAMLQRARYAHGPGRARAAAPDGEAGDKSLADRLSPSHLIRTILALLSPAIAGILSQLLEGLGS
jgi:hypothetical protein